MSGATPLPFWSGVEKLDLFTCYTIFQLRTSFRYAKFIEYHVMKAGKGKVHPTTRHEGLEGE
jgi:hypothetical protein